LPGINFHEPFGYLDYNKLQLDAKCVLSDSGTISEESAIMKFKAVTMRDSIERPEALELGSMLLCGLDSQSVIRGIELAMNLEQSSLPEGYDVSDFSSRVISFLFSTASQLRTWKGLHSN
jgi:UDP-N-acetylglucosamine 2-epimerase (non-hydrolysing)